MNLEELETYYRNPQIQFELVRALGRREFAVFDLGTQYMTRHLVAYARPFLEKGFEYMRVFEKQTKFYSSCARLSRTPWGPQSEWEARRLEWEESFKQPLTFDHCLDIDAPSLPAAYKTAQEVKRIYDDYKLPYCVNFSGSKGLHFRIDGSAIDFMPPQDVPNIAPEIAKGLKAYVSNPDHIDLKAYDGRGRQLIKCHYSIDCASGKVVMPLDDFQFDNFLNIAFTPAETLCLNKLGFRGALYRRDGDKLKEFVQDMTKNSQNEGHLCSPNS